MDFQKRKKYPGIIYLGISFLFQKVVFTIALQPLSLQLFVKKNAPLCILFHPSAFNCHHLSFNEKHYLSKLKAFLLFCGWFPANAQGNWDSFLNFRHRIELLASQGFGVKQKSSLMQIIWKNLSRNFPAFWKFLFEAFCTKQWWFGIKAMIFTYLH